MLNQNHHVAKIEFTRQTALYKEEMVAVFDDRDYTENRVKKIIQSYDNFPRVIICEKEDFEAVFRSLNEENL